MNDGYRVQVKFIGSSSLSPIQVGKWDAGMATPKHTPQGRGYETSLNYFALAMLQNKFEIATLIALEIYKRTWKYNSNLYKSRTND